MPALVKLVTEPIDTSAVIAAVSKPSAGGIDVFLGVVRDENDGKSITLLEYEAYAPMAVGEMERIAKDVERDVPGAVVAVVHRVGSLRVGDLAVACAASAPHRGEAFAACRKLIDEIKHRVPIWKREHGPEGAYWVGWVDARCGHGDH